MHENFRRQTLDKQALAVMRRAASERFENEDVPVGISFENYFKSDIRAKSRTYGGGSLSGIIARNNL